MSYAEATVVKLMTAWSDEPENRGREFSVISKAERLTIWRAEFSRDPRAISRDTIYPFALIKLS